MAAKSRANLKAVFEDGDSPQGSDFEDFIDSFISLTDTSAQSLASNLTLPGVAATTVSAGTVRSDGLSMHKNSFIEAFSDVTAITSIETTGAWTLVSGILTAPNAARFSVSGHDIVYIDTVTARYVVECQLETRGSAAQNLWVAVAKNGTVVSGSISKRRLTVSESVPFTTRTITELKSGDTLNARVQTPDGPIASIESFGVKYMVTSIYFG